MILKRRTKAGKLRYGVRVDRPGGRQEWVGTFATIAEARREEAKAKLERRNPTRMTADRWAEFWLEGYRERNKRSSYDTAAASLKGFIEQWRGIQLDRIDSIQAERWARQNRWRVPVVISLMNAAVEAELIHRNPFKGLSHKGEGRKRTQPLTQEEVHTLAQAAETPSLKALVLFLAYTGLRIGEAFALEWGDIDFEQMRIRVERRVYKGTLDLPKSNRVRLCVLTPPARDALLGLPREDVGSGSGWVDPRKAAAAAASSALVFTSKRGNRLSHSSLSWYWRTIQAAHPRKVTPHHLRHFAAHYLYVTKGLPARVVAAQLGHDDGGKLIETLYGHGDVGALGEIDKAFENVIPLRRASNG